MSIIFFFYLKKTFAFIQKDVYALEEKALKPFNLGGYMQPAPVRPKSREEFETRFPGFKSDLDNFVSTRLGESCRQQDHRQKVIEVFSKAAKEEKAAIEECDRNIARTRDNIAIERKKIATAQQNIAGLKTQQTQVNSEIADLQARRQQNAREIAKSQQVVADAEIQVAEVERRKQEELQKNERSRLDKLIDMFYFIFHEIRKAPEKERATVESYIKSGDSVGIGKVQTSDGKTKTFPVINSMDAIFRYLADHRDITTLNFAPFGINVKGIADLAKFLVQPECRITTVKIDPRIPAEDMRSLLEAVKARKGSQNGDLEIKDIK